VVCVVSCVALFIYGVGIYTNQKAIFVSIFSSAQNCGTIRRSSVAVSYSDTAWSTLRAEYYSALLQWLILVGGSQLGLLEDHVHTLNAQVILACLEVLELCLRRSCGRY
jgi:hypothetical protein